MAKLSDLEKQTLMKVFNGVKLMYRHYVDNSDNIADTLYEELAVTWEDTGDKEVFRSASESLSSVLKVLAELDDEIYLIEDHFIGG